MKYRQGSSFPPWERRLLRNRVLTRRGVGFVEVVKEVFSYNELYPFEAMVDVVEIVPIV